VLPDLAKALKATPARHLTFLTTSFGKSFTAAGFGNCFRERCDEAGVPKGYAAQGLRQTSATRLADHAATPHQLMACSDGTTLREPERYTQAANKKLARSAGALITGTKLANLSGRLPESELSH